MQLSLLITALSRLRPLNAYRSSSEYNSKMMTFVSFPLYIYVFCHCDTLNSYYIQIFTG